jgi:hypothetical protein
MSKLLDNCILNFLGLCAQRNLFYFEGDFGLGKHQDRKTNQSMKERRTTKALN